MRKGDVLVAVSLAVLSVIEFLLGAPLQRDARALASLVRGHFTKQDACGCSLHHRFTAPGAEDRRVDVQLRGEAWVAELNDEAIRRIFSFERAAHRLL